MRPRILAMRTLALLFASVLQNTCGRLLIAIGCRHCSFNWTSPDALDSEESSQASPSVTEATMADSTAAPRSEVATRTLEAVVMAEEFARNHRRSISSHFGTGGSVATTSACFSDTCCAASLGSQMCKPKGHDIYHVQSPPQHKASGQMSRDHSVLV